MISIVNRCRSRCTDNVSPLSSSRLVSSRLVLHSSVLSSNIAAIELTFFAPTASLITVSWFFFFCCFPALDLAALPVFFPLTFPFTLPECTLPPDEYSSTSEEALNLDLLLVETPICCRSLLLLPSNSEPKRNVAVGTVTTIVSLIVAPGKGTEAPTVSAITLPGAEAATDSATVAMRPRSGATRVSGVVAPGTGVEAPIVSAITLLGAGADSATVAMRSVAGATRVSAVVVPGTVSVTPQMSAAVVAPGA